MRRSTGPRAFFGSPLNTGVTLVCILLIAWIGTGLLRWAVVDAVWTGGPEACRGASGACWSYVGHKLGFFVFGYYPAELRWRPAAVLLVLLCLLAGSLRPGSWTPRLLLAWPAALAVVAWLLGGGVGLAPVPSDTWSGLPLTLLVTFFGLAAGFPLGILLALGRTSSLPFFRVACTAFIELMRGLPLVPLLFMASVLIPLLVPAGVTPGKLFRAYLAFTLTASAFIAEVIRGGLRAVAAGQAEAAAALGLGYWRTMQRVVLPQCLAVSVPSLVGVAISFLKDTSLVVVIGLTDLLGAIAGAGRDPAWLGHDVEGYAFAALAYFSLCLAASRYAAWLERRLQTGRQRGAASVPAVASRRGAPGKPGAVPT